MPRYAVLKGFIVRTSCKVRKTTSQRGHNSDAYEDRKKTTQRCHNSVILRNSGGRGKMFWKNCGIQKCSKNHKTT